MNSLASPDGQALRVLRLCSVFMPPARTLRGRGRRYDPIGGMQNHTLELTKALDARGVTQFVITARPPGAPWRESVGDRALVFRTGLPIRRLRQLYCIPAARLALKMADSVDLIHVHLGEDLAALPLAKLAARKHNVPIVVTVHCSMRHTLAAVDPRTRFLKLVGGGIEARFLPDAEAVIALTNRLAARLGEDGVDRRRVHVIPPGVDPALFAPGQPDPFPDVRGPRVVFVGRLARAKGIDLLVEAAARLADRSIQFLIVGDGPERRVAEQAIRRRGLAHSVRITGFLPHERVPAVLQHADVLVLPSRYEELGSILLEAMHCGAPIVAARTGGVPTIVSHEENGLLVPPGEPGALAASINRLIEDPCLARRLASAGRKRAPDFTWTGVGDKVLGIYHSVLEGSRSAAVELELAPVTETTACASS
jgi:glycogen synthase